MNMKIIKAFKRFLKNIKTNKLTSFKEYFAHLANISLCVTILVMSSVS